MTASRPIAIVGGGLAGLSLGIALRKAGVPAEIFEAGDYPRHRVCGEFITGLEDRTIETLGIGPALAGAGSHRRVTWHLRERVIGDQTLPSPARALSRYVLDARLAGLFVAGGGKLTTHMRFKAANYGPGLVHAGGRKPRESSRWFGLKLHARNLTTADDLEFHLGDGAYVGLSSVEEGWINVCGLFRKRPGLQFERDEALPAYLHASGLRALSERLASAEIRPGSRSAVAGFAFDRHVTAEDGVWLGDACATIPPFTGNGMAMAFTGAALALDPLVAWSRDELSWPEAESCIHDALRHEFRVRLSSAAFLHPFLLNCTLQRCLGVALRAGLLPITTLYRLLH
jgi:flavin-dependent dehydrogenase